MGCNCCETLMRALLVIINVVVLVAGLILLVIGGIFYTKKWDFYPDIEQYKVSVSAVLIPMLVLGGILLIVGLIGCIGACTGKSGFLNIYFGIVLLVVIFEVALLIFGYIKKDSVVKLAQKGANDLFDRYRNKFVKKDGTTEITDRESLAVNVVESLVGCCGLINGPEYWKINGNTKTPPGCCIDWDGKMPTDNIKLVDCTDGADNTYQNGCTEEITSLFNEFMIVIVIAICAIIVFELICMMAACYGKKKDMVA